MVAQRAVEHQSGHVHLYGLPGAQLRAVNDRLADTMAARLSRQDVWGARSIAQLATEEASPGWRGAAGRANRGRCRHRVPRQSRRRTRRAEGIYTSSISEWRRIRDAAAREEIPEGKPGRPARRRGGPPRGGPRPLRPGPGWRISTTTGRQPGPDPGSPASRSAASGTLRNAERVHLTADGSRWLVRRSSGSFTHIKIIYPGLPTGRS
jgi:hypothetical protein